MAANIVATWRPLISPALVGLSSRISFGQPNAQPLTMPTLDRDNSATRRYLLLPFLERTHRASTCLVPREERQLFLGIGEWNFTFSISWSAKLKFWVLVPTSCTTKVKTQDKLLPWLSNKAYYESSSVHMPLPVFLPQSQVGLCWTSLIVFPENVLTLRESPKLRAKEDWVRKEYITVRPEPTAIHTSNVSF